MEKYQGAEPGQPPGEGRFVNWPAPGVIPFGVWPGAEQTPMGEAEEKGGREAKEEGKPHPLNPLCFPLLPEERISESGTISAELVCPPNYIYRRQHWPVRVERTVTVERQRVPKATGGRGGPRRKNTELRRKFSQTHLSTWGKKFRAESEQELPKGKHDVPQRAGFLRFVICLLPANPHMHRPYLEF